MFIVVTILLTPLTSNTNGKSYKERIVTLVAEKYIPRWNEISENLYQKYIYGNFELADDFLVRIEESRRGK